MKNYRLKRRLLSKMNSFDYNSMKLGHIIKYHGREFDPGPVPYFVEIDHEIISTVILLPSADSFKNGCCQLQAKVCARITS